MSLIIRGVNLPEKCENCPCYDYIDYVCRADDCFAPFDVENPEERSEHCPLIEIRTPHGRLIDADILLDTLRYRAEGRAICDKCKSQDCQNCVIKFVYKIIREATTVIEAEAVKE